MSDDNDELHSSSGSSESEDNVPSMVVSRARRTNAGNLMSRLLALEESEQAAQAEYDPMWKEEVDDVDFGGDDAEAPDDISLESSSESSEDEGDGDEDAGERELKRQERAEHRARTKKRKGLFQQMQPRKQAKVAPLSAPPGAPSPSTTDATSETATPTPSVPPKKKPERVSWLSSGVEGPTRASSRTLAQVNRAETRERLKEKEKHRLRTLAIMQAAEARRDREKPRAMTQAEHLAEAAEVEARNSKSLSRWEEAERKRVEEQKARLEAMKNRTLEGPFVRYWSGPAVWIGDQVVHVGKDGDVGKLEEEHRKKVEEEYRKKVEAAERKKQAAAARETDPVATEPEKNGEDAMDVDKKPEDALAESPAPKDAQPPAEAKETTSAPAEPSGTGDGFLGGIEYWAQLPNPQRPVHPVIDAPPLKADESKSESQEKTANPESMEVDIQPDKTETSTVEAPSAERRSTPPAEKPQETKEAPDGDLKPEKIAEEQPAAAPSPMQTDQDPPPQATEKVSEAPPSAPVQPQQKESIASLTPAQAEQERPVTSPSAAPAAEETQNVPTAPTQTTEDPKPTLAPAQPTETLPGAPAVPAQPAQQQSATSLPSPPPKQESPAPIRPPPPSRSILATRNLITIVSPDLPPRPTAPPSKADKSAPPSDTLALLKLLLAYDPSNPRPLVVPPPPPPKPGRRAAKPPSTDPPVEPCIITGKPAHFRDPATGLPYADATAYRLLKQALAAQCRWSALLGCYVGPAFNEGATGKPAAGVPEWFADGKRTVVEKKKEEEEEKAVEGKPMDGDGEKGVAVATSGWSIVPKPRRSSG